MRRDFIVAARAALDAKRKSSTPRTQPQAPDAVGVDPYAALDAWGDR